MIRGWVDGRFSKRSYAIQFLSFFLSFLSIMSLIVIVIFFNIREVRDWKEFLLERLIIIWKLNFQGRKFSMRHNLIMRMEDF